MPVLFSDHLPLPSLKSYIVLSIIFLGLGFFYSRDASSSSDGQSSHDTKQPHSSNNIDSLFGKESAFAWSLVNLAYCGLFFIGKLIQRVVFGDLRLTEEQHIQEKFWNFVFYKFIFVFGVINAQTLNEVMHWTAWFSMVGFWKIFGQLCSDRFDFILSSPNASRKPYTRLLLLLIAILMSSVCMSFAAYYSDFAENLNIFAFMLAECILLGLECLHMVTSYGIHFNGDDNWESKGMTIYYVDFIFQVIIHGTNLIHHFHMLLWSNVFLSMASLVLYWNIRAIFSDLTRNIEKHKLYKRVTQSVEEKLELLEEDDLSDYEDNCAICWDSMKTARKLTCGHIFHQSCLCSWLQQDTSCPTCRISLANVISLPERPPNHMTDGVIDQRQFADVQATGNQRNHFFHFDGTRIANWFPSFSIEVFHGGNESSDIEFEQMAVQLHTMFPTIPYNAILDDVRRTQSPEITAENILEGNIICPVDEDEEEAIEQPYMQLDERSTLSNEEIPSQEPSRNGDIDNTAPSESESSDTNSCVEFHDSSEKRHSAFRNKRRRMLTDARRRFTGKSSEKHGLNCSQTTVQP